MSTASTPVLYNNNNSSNNYNNSNRLTNHQASESFEMFGLSSILQATSRSAAPTPSRPRRQLLPSLHRLFCSSNNSHSSRNRSKRGFQVPDRFPYARHP